jgi:hypothetical protein
MTTYNRKYYLIREVKKLNLEVLHEGGERAVLIPFDRQHEVKNNKYLLELRDKHNYGLQTELK